jgi:acyl carrier protein
MQSSDDIRTTLANLLEEEMGEPSPPLSDELDLREGLGLDSVDVVGLVMRLEREYRIRLSMDDLVAVNRVGDLIALLEAKLMARPEGDSSRPGVAAA